MSLGSRSDKIKIIFKLIVVLFRFSKRQTNESMRVVEKKVLSLLTQKEEVIAEHFSSGNTLPLVIKLEKTNSNFCLNFCAVEAHTKVRGVQQI